MDRNCIGRFPDNSLYAKYSSVSGATVFSTDTSNRLSGINTLGSELGDPVGKEEGIEEGLDEGTEDVGIPEGLPVGISAGDVGK